MQGKEVWIRPDIDLVGRVWVCDAQGRPLAEAVEETLLKARATHEDMRAAMSKKARIRRAAKASIPADFLIHTSTTQILAERADRAKARESELERSLSAAPQRELQIVRPDLVDAVAALDAQSKRAAIRSTLQGTTQAGEKGVDGFAMFASDGTSSPAEPAVDYWRMFEKPDDDETGGRLAS